MANNAMNSSIDLELAGFANGIYSNDFQPGPGWKSIEVDMIFTDGFYAAAWQNTINGQVVVAYRGTDGLSDVFGVDRAIATGQWHSQFTQAATFMSGVATELQVSNDQLAGKVLVTGHSAGAAVGEVISNMFGLDGASFEGPAVARLVNTQQYRDIALSLGLDPSVNQISGTYLNYRVNGSGISGGITGDYLVAVQEIAQMESAGVTDWIISILAGTAMGSGAVSLASLVIHDQLAKHSMTGILTYMAFMEYAGMVLGGAEETGGSLRVAMREGGGYDVLNAYGEHVGEIINGNMTVRDKYGASFTINKDGTTAESFPADTSPIENTITITTKNPGATENGAADPTDGTGFAGGTAVETGSYKVSFSNGELDSSSVYASAIAAMTTGGIRPGNWTVMPDASLVPVPSHLISDISQTLTIPVDAGINPGSYTIDPSGLIIPSIHTSVRTYVDPLILDLNGDGVRLTNFSERTVLFDIDHDGGSLEQTGWVSAEDGILAHDLNGNGKIDGIHETLSEYYNGAAGTEGEAGEKLFSDGFAALQSLDSNHDNQFTSADAAWDQLRVWVDADSDGITDAGELKTLTDLGISAIDLNPERQSGLVNGGNEILAEGSFTQNGEQRQAQAVNFIASSAGSIFTSTGTGLRTDTRDDNGQTTSSYLHTGADGAVLDAATLNVQNLTGGDGNDTLTGDANANWLAGGRGADILNAGDGDDVLLFDHEDTLDGGEGNDIAQVIGDEGVVLNLAHSHIEAVVGGRGDDILIGGGRSSVFMRGGDGDDILIGGAANDVLLGENGSDLIDGGAGNDLIRGGRGQDQIMGGTGDDIIFAGQDDDHVYGGAGNDVLNGGQGDDRLDGGEGTDIAEYSGSFADYRIVRLNDVNGATQYRVVDTRTGRDGADTIINIEKLSFADVSGVDLTLDNPLPVDDVVGIANRSGVKLIKVADLLANDRDWQGDALKITKISDIVGGSIVGSYNSTTKEWTPTLTANGEIQFTPDAKYTGVISFKYKIADADNTPGATAYIAGTTTSAEMRGQVFLTTPDMPTDSLFTEQWYLSEINALPVWNDGYTGKGVRIAQFEPGMPFSVGPEIFDTQHPDLKPNIDADWLADAEGNIPQTASNHATLVAGIMVAARDGQGAVGVAYDASLSGYYIPNDGQDLGVLRRMAQYDVVNNSWGTKDRFLNNFHTNPALENVYQYAVANGREGLGSIIVAGAGNARLDGGNTNDASFSSNRYSIAVGAINAKTDISTLTIGSSPFSNPGASILVSAPGSNVASTSRILQGDDGSVFGSDTQAAQGTSFATPIVAGVVALMLEANPELGWRDVQEILALTAKKVTDASTQWVDNKANNANGGGMHISHDYGFGEVDALAAVRLAETWTKQQVWSNEYQSPAFSSGNINLSVPDNNATGISRSIAVSNTPIKVEHVEVTVNLTHANAGDLIIKLVSPNGTESILMNRPGKTPGSTAADTGDVTFNGSTTLDYTFTTVRDWGESANGNWTIKVIDANTGATGKLNSWSIRLYGAVDNGSDQYVYTDEFATLAASNTARKTLNDTDGGRDTINTAAISGPVTVNLATGYASLNGAPLTISSSWNIENVVGSTYGDNITGNSAANLLYGGRGADTISGGDGGDLIWGGNGNDTLTGGTGMDGFVIEWEAGAVDTVMDFVVGTDRIVLSGFGSFTSVDISKVQEGANTRLLLPDGQSVVLWNVTASNLTSSSFVTAGDGMHVRDFSDKTGFGFGTDGTDPQTYWTTGDYVYWAGEGGEQVFGGSGHDRILGGGGNDVLVGENATDAATGGNDVLRGGAGMDVLRGGPGNDTLWGDGDIDYLNGDAGNDVLYLEGDEGSGLASGNFFGNLTIVSTLSGAAVAGGAGDDRFVLVEDMTDSASQGILRNLIHDFEVSNPNEKIDLSKIRAVHGFEDLHFNTITVLVNGIAESYLRIWLGEPTIGTQYITLKNVSEAQLTAANFIFTDGVLPEPVAENAVVMGTLDDDVLIGDAGGNRLDGGWGADMMEGRTGDDTYVVDEAGDRVVELPGGGYDAVESFVSFTLPANVEQLTLVGMAFIDGTGNDEANRIVGNSGNNVLDGGAGSDDLAGKAGDDTYVVDSGSDRITENANEGTDTVRASVSWTLGKHLENLHLTGLQSINATGNELNNSLVGNDADNILDGAQGADTMVGAGGNDTYFVDNAADVVIESANEGMDTVYSTVNLALGANLENLVLFGAATSGTGNELDNQLIGNSLNNSLIGGLGNDILDGVAGADTMSGGLGDDIYYVDNVGDIVTENLNEGSDTVISTITYSLATRVHVENLRLSGNAAINATGNALDNLLIGNEAANSLSGGSGNDTLDGGAGVDSLRGGQGDDTYIVDLTSSGALQDTVTEYANEGSDTLKVRGTSTNSGYVTMTLAANLENLDASATGNSKLDLTGNEVGNSLIGNSAANTLIGGAGNDRLDGGSGDDLLSGGIGDDIYAFNIGSGHDQIIESSGSDRIAFGAGIDPSDVLATRSNGEVTLTLTSGDSIRFADYGNGSYAIEEFQFADGVFGADWLNALLGIGLSVSGLNAVATYTEDQPLNLTPVVINGSGNVEVTLVLSEPYAGTLNTGTYGSAASSFDAGSGVWSASGAVADVNALLAALVFTPAANYHGDLSVAVSVWDGVLPDITGSWMFSGVAVNDVPFNSAAPAMLADGLEDTPYVIHLASLLEGYSDVDGDLLNVADLTATNGMLSAFDDANQSWTFTPVADFNGTVTLTYRVTDGIAGIAVSQSFTLIAANEAPTISLLPSIDYTDTIADDVFPEFAGTVSATDADGDVLTYGIVGGIDDGVLVSKTGSFGILTVSKADGAYTYTPDAGAIEALKSHASELFEISVTDPAGGSAATALTINLSGADDVTGFAGELAGSVAEDVQFVATGTLQVQDRDAGDAAIVAQTSTSGIYGDFSIQSDGYWVYTLRNTDANVQALKAGESVSETFTVMTAGGVSAQVSVVIAGNNDAPVTLQPALYETATEAALFSYTLPAGVFADIDSGDVLSYSASLADGSVLPGWLSFDPVARVFSGMPDTQDIGQISIKVSATDLAGAAAKTMLTLSIASSIPRYTGTSGNDTITGTIGAEQMVGLAGDDTYTVNHEGDLVVESANEGTDKVNSSISYVLTEHVENLTLTGSALINGTGNALDNILSGNSAANRLSGEAGNDTLDGGAGNDVLRGGTGDDTYIVDLTTNGALQDTVTEYANEGNDTLKLRGRYAKTSYVTLALAANLENLDAGATTSSRLHLTGNELDNKLTGNTAANTLTGNAGNDTLDGGAGVDILIGGAGNDTYIVDMTSAGKLQDTVTENAGQGTDTLQLRGSSSNTSYVTITLASNLERLDGSATGNSKLHFAGNAADNLLVGNSAANTLTGNAGNDILIGGAGNDTLNGGTGSDTYVFKPLDATANGGLGLDTILSGGFVTDLDGILEANEDILDLTGFFAPGTVNTGNIGEYLRMSGSTLQIDRDGGGNSFVSLVNMTGTSITTNHLDELLTAGQIIA